MGLACVVIAAQADHVVELPGWLAGFDPLHLGGERGD